MLPLLREGRDLVHIVCKENCDFGVSDVVLYKRGKQLVLHRIISKDGQNYMILGDNQYTPENVSENQILGVMTAFLKDGQEILRNDAKYQIYVNRIMNMSKTRRRILAYIRRLV